jgi:hypothetical protein
MGYDNPMNAINEIVLGCIKGLRYVSNNATKQNKLIILNITENFDKYSKNLPIFTLIK